MRLAARSDVLDALASHIAGASSRQEEVAHQIARMEQLAELVTQLRSSGLSEQAALTQGLKVLDGEEMPPRWNFRFASTHGDAS